MVRKIAIQTATGTASTSATNELTNVTHSSPRMPHRRLPGAPNGNPGPGAEGSRAGAATGARRAGGGEPGDGRKTGGGRSEECRSIGCRRMRRSAMQV